MKPRGLTRQGGVHPEANPVALIDTLDRELQRVIMTTGGNLREALKKSPHSASSALSATIDELTAAIHGTADVQAAADHISGTLGAREADAYAAAEAVVDAALDRLLSRLRQWRGLEQQEGHRLSVVFEAWAGERIAAGAWSPPVAKQNAAYIGRFVERFDDPEVEAVTRQQVVEWRGELLKSRTHTGRVMSTTTVNKHCKWLAACMEYAVEAGWISSNPAKGVSVKGAKGQRQQRSAFTEEQLRLIFENLKQQRSRGPGHMLIPLLMLYTGMRPEEAAQLRKEDFHWDPEGVDVIDLRPEDHGRRRKTESSKRLIPVPSRLRFLVQVAEGDGWLFPELNPGASGKRAEAVGRWFNGTLLRNTLKIADPKLVLYSIRHSVATRLRDAGHEENRISELLGHSPQGQTAGRYAKSLPASELVPLVESLDWGI